jgi:hypothetical protein
MTYIALCPHEDTAAWIAQYNFILANNGGIPPRYPSPYHGIFFLLLRYELPKNPM